MSLIGKYFGLNNTLNNFIDKSEGKVSTYSEFVAGINDPEVTSKLKFVGVSHVDSVLKKLKEEKDMFENGVLDIYFDVKGTKSIKIGKKIENVYDFNIEPETKEDSVKEFFNEVGKFKVKDKDITKELIDKEISRVAKLVGKGEKAVLSVGDASVTIWTEPHRYIKFAGARIDLAN